MQSRPSVCLSAWLSVWLSVCLCHTLGMFSSVKSISYWASEASPTLGCSIEISRDIVYSLYVGLSTILWETQLKKNVCQNAWEDLRSPNTRMFKVNFGSLNQSSARNP